MLAMYTESDNSLSDNLSQWIGAQGPLISEL